MRISSQALPWFLLGAGAFLFLLLFTLPLAPVFFRGDVTLCLLNAGRMLRGQVIYRDFFQITFPGAELLYFGLSRLFGPRAWIPNVMLLLLGLGLTWVSIAISRKVMRGLDVFLPGVLLLTLAIYNGRDASHHWYSILLVMIAVVLIMEERTPRRLAAVGVLCGFAMFFTQSRGVVALIGVGVFLIWDHRRKKQICPGLLQTEAYLIGPFLVTAILTNGYFIWKAGLTRFLYCTFVFVMWYFPAHSPADNLKAYLLAPPQLQTWHGLPWVLLYLLIHVLVPSVYLLFFLRYRRESRLHPEHPWDRLMLLNLTGLFLFFGVASAPSFFRLCVVSLPAIILLVWFLSCPGGLENVLRTLLWMFALVLIVVEPLRAQRHLSPSLDTPSGRIAFFPPEPYDRFRWIRDHTRPSDYFYEAEWGDTYFLLGLNNPAPMPFLTNSDYTRPEQVQHVMKALEERHVWLVLWSLGLDIPERDDLALVDHLGPLREYLRSRYRVIKTFADGEQVWQRKD